MEEECIFCRIADGILPSSKVYEDDDVIAFLDIYPIKPGHVLVVPKKHTADIFDTDEETLGKMMAAAKKIAPAVMKAAKADAVNIGMNNKPASGQVVFHIHLHVIPRYKNDGLKNWPQHPYDSEQHRQQMMEQIKKELK